jgi:hypothetical protein
LAYQGKHRPRRRKLSLLIALFLTAMNSKPGLAPGFLLFGVDWDSMRLGIIPTRRDSWQCCNAKTSGIANARFELEAARPLLSGAASDFVSPNPICGTRRPPPRLLERVEPSTAGGDLTDRGNLQEAAMAHWHDTMVDRPETDGAVYVTGWTISGLAVLGAVVVVWLLGI